MTTPLAVGDLIEYKIGTYYAGQAGVNTLYTRVATVGILPITLEDLCLNIEQNVSGEYKLLMSIDATFYGVQAKRLTPGPATVPVISTTQTGIGSGAGRALPGQVAAIITLRAAFAGRKYRGRIYLPFLAAVFQDNTLNRPTAAAITIMDSLGSNISLGWTVAAAGRTGTTTAVIKESGTNFTETITSFTSQPRWGTQRRRSSSGRPNVYPPF